MRIEKKVSKVFLKKINVLDFNDIFNMDNFKLL